MIFCVHHWIFTGSWACCRCGRTPEQAGRAFDDRVKGNLGSHGMVSGAKRGKGQGVIVAPDRSPFLPIKQTTGRMEGRC